MENTMTLQQILPLVQKLPVLDRIHLITVLTPQIERDLRYIQPMSRKSLRGLWRRLEVTESDIDTARKELWREFPREDV